MSSHENIPNKSNSPEELEKNIKKKESEEEYGPTVSPEKKKENKQNLQKEIEKLRKNLGL